MIESIKRLLESLDDAPDKYERVMCYINTFLPEKDKDTYKAMEILLTVTK